MTRWPLFVWLRAAAGEAVAFLAGDPSARYRFHKRRAERLAAHAEIAASTAGRWLQQCPAWMQPNARMARRLDGARIDRVGQR